MRVFPFIAVALIAASPAFAQPANYPNQPIRMIVTVPAGGGVDTAVRIVGEGVRQRLGQPVIIENKGGQAGNLGAEAAYAAEPDGYTLMASQPAPLTVNVLLYKKLNYDPAAFVPVAIMSTIPNALAVRADFPARTVEEFIAYAKANPGKLNYASQGTGTTSHLTAELFQTLAGTKLQHVPYKGTAPALNDLIAGHVDLMFNEMSTSLELHKSGKVRILAVASDKRFAAAPELPTFAERGVKDFISSTWNAISAPPKTPDALVGKLNATIIDALKSDEIATRFRELNLQAEFMSPAQAKTFIATDARRWADVIRQANVKPE
jgi:tripartite-type tricarboxylate transporter receptor subunit TctC